MLNDLRRLMLSIKNMKFWFFALLPLLFIILPSVQSNILLGEQPYAEKWVDFFRLAQIILPVSSIYWLFLYFRELFDNEIQEVLYAGDHKTKLRFIVWFFVLYQIAAIPLYCWYLTIFSDAWQEILRLAFQALFLCAVFYACPFITGSSMIALGLTVAVAGSMIFVIPSNWTVNLFQLNTKAEDTSIIGNMSYLVLTSLLLLIGRRGERRFFERQQL